MDFSGRTVPQVDDYENDIGPCEAYVRLYKRFRKELNNKNRLPVLRNIGSLIESPSYYAHLTAGKT